MTPDADGASDVGRPSASRAETVPIHNFGPPEPPMPPNELVPYKGTIFGLDKARRDCRFEMIKIVREVRVFYFWCNRMIGVGC